MSYARTLSLWKTTCTTPTGMWYCWNRACTDCSVPFGGRGMVSMVVVPRWRTRTTTTIILPNIGRWNWRCCFFPWVSFVHWVSTPIPYEENYWPASLYRGTPQRHMYRHHHRCTTNHMPPTATVILCSHGGTVQRPTARQMSPWPKRRPSVAPIRGLRTLEVMKHHNIRPVVVMIAKILSSPLRRQPQPPTSDRSINPMVVRSPPDHRRPLPDSLYHHHRNGTQTYRHPQYYWQLYPMNLVSNTWIAIRVVWREETWYFRKEHGDDVLMDEMDEIALTIRLRWSKSEDREREKQNFPIQLWEDGRVSIHVNIAQRWIYLLFEINISINNFVASGSVSYTCYTRKQSFSQNIHHVSVCNIFI